jgi:mannose-6-phosphate isomerase-like protein (cupin superfamily)
LVRLSLIVLGISSLATGAARGQQRDSGFVRQSASRDAATPAAITPAAARREAEKQRRRVDFLPEKTLSDAAASLTRWNGLGRTVHTSGDEQTTYLLVRRKVTSQAEVHARWDDLVIVRSGAGAVEFGDSLVGSTYRAPGERSGGTFHKSYQLVVHAGDIVRIPAAVPHAFVVSGSDPLEYLVIKQRRQDLPIRWFRAADR